jgi:hypothetical protein
VREVDLLGVLIIFEHRKVDDPAEIEAVFVDEAELFGDAGAGEAGELGGLRLLAGGEEDAVVRAEAELGDQLAGRSSPWFLAIGPPSSPPFCVM